MKIPYGEADFYSLIKDGQLYIDRTDRIPQVEDMGKALLFLRPRRFGKSLWLRTLSCYYDIRYRDEHADLFGQLAISGGKTAHTYFVLEWDFSAIVPELSSEDLGFLINSYINQRIHSFLSDYRDHLPPGSAEAFPSRMGTVAVDNLDALLALIRQTPHHLCLLVDEYDNFANEVMLSDPLGYKDLVKAEGPLRGLMKWVKQAKKGLGLDRLFFTGVSPIVMADITSGMNILKDVSLRPRLADLCGFRDGEIRQLLKQLLAEMAHAGPVPDVEEALSMMRTWYNGYRFAPETREKVYNPTLVLYFLDHLQEYQSFPDEMLDANLAMDESKLTYLAREAPGRQAIMDVIQNGEPLEVRGIVNRFSMSEMLDSKGHDQTYLGSFLYYFGMLTLEGGRTPRRRLLLIVPNLVTQSLYIDHIRHLLLADEMDPRAPEDLALTLVSDGDIGPLARYVETRVFRRFSNLDYRWMNELAVKTAFMTLLFNDVSHMILSEPELDRSRADLCLLRRPDARTDALWDLLMEFKYIKLGKLPGRPSGKDLRERSDADLLALEPVDEAFTDADAQLDRYRDVLMERFGDALRLRCYAVVALGFERILVHERVD